jgi:hypothetical protein
VSSSTSLTANISIGSDAAAGNRPFSVTNATPGGGKSGDVIFVVNNPVPVLSSVAPNSGGRLQTLDLVVTGVNFINGVTTLNMGTGITVNSLTVSSSTSLIANVTIGVNALVSSRNISVTNAVPGGGTSGTQPFTVTNPVPVAVSMVPSQGSRLQTLDVSFTGANFIAGVTGVDLGVGITVNSVTVVSSTSLSANITIGSAAATGVRNAYISNAAPGGGPSASLGFSVINPPAVLSALSASSGKRGDVLDVTFTGTGFISGVTTLDAGTGITVNSVTVQSSTSLKATVSISQSATPGVRSWTLTNPSPGGGISAQLSFSVALEVPTLVGPVNESTGHGTSLALTWNAIPGASGYRVQVASSAGFATPVLDDSTLTSPTRAIVLLAGNKYFWRIAARVSGAWSSFSSAWALSVADGVALNGSVVFPAAVSGPTDYRLFSMPGSAAVTAGDILTGSSPFEWRLYRDKGTPLSYPAYLEELTPSSPLQQGEGYWLIKKGTLSIARSTSMPQLSVSGTFNARLHTGWNIIGCPFDRSISWSAVIAANGLPPSTVLWDYTGSLVAVSSMEPFHGYYFANSGSLDTLRIPYRAGAVTAKLAEPAGLRWRVKIALVGESEVDSENEFGIMDGTLAERDAEDAPKPPLHFLQTHITMDRPGWDSTFIQYSRDYRPQVGDGQVWPFTVNNPHKGGGVLEFQGIEDIPASYDAVLIRLDSPVPVDLRKHPAYTYEGRADIEHYKVIIGTHEFVEGEIDKLLPSEITLWQNYPNPFNPETSISYALPHQAHVQLDVYSVLGERVRSLVNGMEGRGVRTAVWNATNDDGARVASGMYFYLLKVGGSTQAMKKMLLIK